MLLKCRSPSIFNPSISLFYSWSFFYALELRCFIFTNVLTCTYIIAFSFIQNHLVLLKGIITVWKSGSVNKSILYNNKMISFISKYKSGYKTKYEWFFNRSVWNFSYIQISRWTFHEVILLFRINTGFCLSNKYIKISSYLQRNHKLLDSLLSVVLGL